eukprot:jgi/Ulvmu1/11767/UM008_0181.1
MLSRYVSASVRKGLLTPKLLPLLYECVLGDVNDRACEQSALQMRPKHYAEGQVGTKSSFANMFEDTVGGEASFGHISADNTSSSSQFEGHESRSKELFDSCWEKLEKILGSTIVTPKEIIWLNGPPGAGKGANLEFIKRIRGLSYSVVMSRVLARHPETATIMENGGLVSDEKVCDCLLQAVFNPAYASPSGCIVDGFPRSEIQVEFVKHLYSHLNLRYAANVDAPQLRAMFPKPSFKIVVLYVNEAVSIARQMARQTKSAIHNQKVREALAGNMIEERGTDKSADKCRLRYRVFRQHYPSLTKLQSLMPFSVIDATGSLEDCEAQIAHELRYQSSLDLDERTYAAVSRIPLSREVVQHSRQHLIQRLDEYQLSQTETFHKVLSILYEETLPRICSNAMAGFVEFTSKDDVFEKQYGSCDMFIDVLTDRGFSVSYMRRVTPVPVRIDAATGEVHTRRSITHCFRIQFPGGTVRDVRNIQTQQSSKTRIGQDNPLLTTSVIPDHLDHGKKPGMGNGIERSHKAHDAALG